MCGRESPFDILVHPSGSMWAKFVRKRIWGEIELEALDFGLGGSVCHRAGDGVRSDRDALAVHAR